MGPADIATLAVILILGASAGTWAIAGGIGRSSPEVPGSVFVAVSVLMASVLTLVAALRRWRHGVPVAPWLGMTIACHVWLVGEVIRAVILFYLDEDLSVPSIVDIPSLAFAPIVIWSFLPMFRLQQDRLGRAGVLLDGVVIGVLTLVAVVTPVLGDQLPGDGLMAGQRAVVMLWLLSAVLATLPGIPIALTSPVRDRVWVWPIVAGFAFLGVGQAVYADGLRQGTAVMSHPVALCWSMGFLFIATAAVFGGWQSRAVAERPVTGGSMAPRRSGFGLLPVLRTGPTFVTAGVVGLTLLFIAIEENLSLPATIVCIIAAVAIAARIMFSAAQTEQLLRASARLDGERGLETALLEARRSGVDPVIALGQAVATALGVTEVHFRNGDDAADRQAVPARPEGRRHGDEDRFGLGDGSIPIQPVLTVPLMIDDAQVGTASFIDREAATVIRARHDAIYDAVPWIGPALLRAQGESAALRRDAMISGLVVWLREGAAVSSRDTLEGRLSGLRTALGAVASRIDRWDEAAGTSRIVSANGTWSEDWPVLNLSEVLAMRNGPAARFLSSEPPRAGDGPPRVLFGLLSSTDGSPVTLTVRWPPSGGPVTGEEQDAAFAITLLNLAALGFGAAAVSPQRNEAVRHLARQALQESDDRQAALDGLIRAALAAGGVSHAAVLRWAPISDEYEVAATVAQPGSRPLFILGERSSLAMLPSIRRVVEARLPTRGVVSSTMLTAGETALLEDAGALTFALLPVLQGDRCFGALVLGFDVIEPPVDDAVTVFEEIAVSAAAVIDHERLASRWSQTAQANGASDQRPWIGADLPLGHSEPGQ